MNDISGTYTITKNDREAGTVTISAKGLMTVFEAECSFFSDGVYRLFAVSGDNATSIGVMMPRNNGLALTKSFTKATLSALNIGLEAEFLLAKSGELPILAPPPTPPTAVILPPDIAVPIPEPEIPEGWHAIQNPSVLFSGPDIINSCKNAQGALVKTASGATLLAIPVSDDVPFPMMPVFCLGTPEKIDGRDYLMFTVKNGTLSL